MCRVELLPANPDVLEGVDDLMQLSYLNEPSVLYNLQSRYSQDVIYVSITFSCCLCFPVRFMSLLLQFSCFLSVEQSRASIDCNQSFQRCPNLWR